MVYKIEIYGKQRIIKNIIEQTDKTFYATYRGHKINIYPMYGKKTRNGFDFNLPSGEYGVDVCPFEQSKIVEAVCPSVEAGIKMAMENILLEEKSK